MKAEPSFALRRPGAELFARCLAVDLPLEGLPVVACTNVLVSSYRVDPSLACMERKHHGNGQQCTSKDGHERYAIDEFFGHCRLHSLH